VTKDKNRSRAQHATPPEYCRAARLARAALSLVRERTARVPSWKAGKTRGASLKTAFGTTLLQLSLKVTVQDGKIVVMNKLQYIVLQFRRSDGYLIYYTGKFSLSSSNQVRRPGDNYNMSVLLKDLDSKPEMISSSCSVINPTHLTNGAIGIEFDIASGSEQTRMSPSLVN
jgi:hypothetical protein